LYERLDKGEPLFRTSKEIEWAIEILGYGFIPPHYQYVKEDRNYLKLILNIYEFTLCEEIEVVVDKKTIRKISSPQVLQKNSSYLLKQPILDYSDYSHQKILLKMLSHLTLLFEKKNFEKKPNPLMGGNFIDIWTV